MIFFPGTVGSSFATGLSVTAGIKAGDVFINMTDDDASKLILRLQGKNQAKIITTDITASEAFARGPRDFHARCS